MKSYSFIAALAALSVLGAGCSGEGNGVGGATGPTARLTGSVLFNNDQPVQNRQLRVVAGSTGSQVMTTTSSTGAFSISLPTGSSYRVDVFKVDGATIETQRQTGVLQGDVTLNPIKLSSGPQ